MGRGLIVSRYRREYSIPASCQRLTFLTKSNRQGLLLKTLSTVALLIVCAWTRNCSTKWRIYKAQLWNLLLLLQQFSGITTNDCRWWNCSYLLAKHWMFHWWRQLSCTLVRYSRPVEGYSGTLHKCGSWVMYSLTCRTVHKKNVNRQIKCER